MNICVIGAGYVGLVVSSCLSKLGHEVKCIETDQQKLEKLKRGESTIYEPGLTQLLKENIEKGLLEFHADFSSLCVDFDVYYLAVGTPSAADGSADLSYIHSAIDDIISYVKKDFILVTKSTVPVGTGVKIKNFLVNRLNTSGINFQYVSNPEFLREGSAISDFLNPDRIVIGVSSAYALRVMQDVYKKIIDTGVKVVSGNCTDAELIKYASNCFLATKISFINEMSIICEEFSADIHTVALGIGADSRISDKFLNAGCGYGGSCFPKDVDELISLAKRGHLDLPMLKSIPIINERQKRKPFDLFFKHFHGDVLHKKIAVWGASFKPNTDDIRCAPSLTLIQQAYSAGVTINIYDPVALPNLSEWLDLKNFDNVNIVDDQHEVLKDCDALIVITEWDCFLKPSWDDITLILNERVIIDARGIYSRSDLEAKGISYLTIGSKADMKISDTVS